MKNILVTGGLGFIGSNLTNRLLEENYDVTVVDNLSSAREDYREILKNNNKLKFLHMDFADDCILEKIHNKEFDVVFHVAAIPRVSYSVEYPFLTTDNNINKTTKLLEACRGNINRFIFSSSSSVYGGASVRPTPVSYLKDPKSPYAWQKSCIEDLIKIFCSLYSMDAVSLRYFNVFGPGQFGNSPYSTAVSAWCNAIKEGKPLRKDGTGYQSRDLCYIDNVVEANLKTMLCTKSFSGECYNIACCDSTSNNEILEIFSQRFGNLNIQEAPFRKGDVMHTCADISETIRVLNYKPKIKFKEGLYRTFTWWKI